MTNPQLPNSRSQAFDERRLALLVDVKGCIKKASRSPTSLFGFDPRNLVGVWIGWLVGWLVVRAPAGFLADLTG